jgi:hypothetical protein
MGLKFHKEEITKQNFFLLLTQISQVLLMEDLEVMAGQVAWYFNMLKEYPKHIIGIFFFNDSTNIDFDLKNKIHYKNSYM